jgi:hypothetical protein
MSNNSKRGAGRPAEVREQGKIKSKTTRAVFALDDVDICRR